MGNNVYHGNTQKLWHTPTTQHHHEAGIVWHFLFVLSVSCQLSWACCQRHILVFQLTVLLNVSRRTELNLDTHSWVIRHWHCDFPGSLPNTVCQYLMIQEQAACKLLHLLKSWKNFWNYLKKNWLLFFFLFLFHGLLNDGSASLSGKTTTFFTVYLDIIWSMENLFFLIRGISQYQSFSSWYQDQ